MPIKTAAIVVRASVEPIRRAVAAGMMTKLDTSTTPTVLTDTTTTHADIASSRYSNTATGTPEIAASSGSKIAYAMRDHSTTVMISASSATATTTCSTSGPTA